MDKCFIFTILMLVYLVAVVDSQPSYMCQKDDETKDEKNKSPDLRLEFTSDTTSDTTSTKQYLCNVISEPVKSLECIEWKNSFPTSCSDADPEWLHYWSVWTDCTMSNGKGIMYRYRDVPSASGETICCLTPCISLVDRQECRLHAASSTTEKENGKEVEKRYTLTEIILVTLCCLLMDVIITTLVFVFYMKRTQRGCFSKDIKDVQGDSKQQSGPDMQFLNENVVVKKNDPNNPKSADSKNENKAEEAQYQSLNSNQVGNDQQTYDQFIVNEPRSDRQGHQPGSIRLQQTGNDYQIDHTRNLQHNNEGVYEYCRDSDIDGHNYFVLEREKMSRESRARNLGRPETHAKMVNEVKDSTLGTEDKQSDAAHEYFLLERFENGHNQD